MNETGATLSLRSFMDGDEGWGREQGRSIYPKLMAFVESHAGTSVFRVSFKGVARTDISFASETVIELARRFRGNKGFCLIDLEDADMAENWEAAAERKSQPLVLWKKNQATIIGAAPTPGTFAALQYALSKRKVRAAEFVTATPGMTIANASAKFKQLWEQGFLLRREETAESGGIEFVYFVIG